MAERAFARIGYLNEQGQFVPRDIRAQDVFDTKGVSAEAHQTDEQIHLSGEQTATIAGAAAHLTNDQIHLSGEQAAKIAGAVQSTVLGQSGGVATLDENGHIPAGQLDLGKYQTSANVNTYAEMLALDSTVKNGCPVGGFVFVTDATGDSSVKAGWASYRRIATNGGAGDYVKVAEGESLDINIPELEGGIAEAKQAAQEAKTTADSAVTAAGTADGKAVAAQTAADAAQTAADAAQTAADAAQQTADSAVTAAGTADGKAVAAQTAADAAAAEAAKLDFAYCASEQDMSTKNLRAGAFVLMAVDNN